MNRTSSNLIKLVSGVLLGLLLTAPVSALHFDDLDRAAQRLPRLQSLLISQGNSVPFEAYVNGRECR